MNNKQAYIYIYIYIYPDGLLLQVPLPARSLVELALQRGDLVARS